MDVVTVAILDEERGAGPAGAAAVVRPPLVKLSRAEIDRIRAVLVEAGLIDVKASRDAA